MQLVIVDDYGVEDTSKWREEKLHFIRKVIQPAVAKSTPSLTDECFALIDELVAGHRAADGSGEPDVEINDPLEYEVYCLQVLEDAGWSGHLTKGSGDQGADIIAEREGFRAVVQCKLYSSPVGNKAVQEVIAARDFLGANAGIVVSNADFTRSAKELANVTGILLLHHSQLPDVAGSPEESTPAEPVTEGDPKDVRVQCPNCARDLRATLRLGANRCPHCLTLFDVEEAG